VFFDHAWARWSVVLRRDGVIGVHRLRFA
jgi:hypothetical protein